MGIDLAMWHPGLLFALMTVLGGLLTGIIITALSVGLVQWRKTQSLKQMREFVEDLIAQGYTIEEIERLSAAFFEQRPGQYSAKPLKSPAR